MVGEIRDGETASLAINAALTGHLVLSTLHTNSAAGTIPRLVDMGAQPFLLVSTIRALIAQRLVRKLCPHCLQGQVYSSETLQLVYNNKNIVDIIRRIALKHYSQEEIEQLEFKDEFVFYKGMGCKACGSTGFKGRIGIYEVMEMTDDLKKVVLEGGSSDAIEEMAVNSGMQTMLENGIEKALSGTTSLEEVIRVIKS